MGPQGSLTHDVLPPWMLPPWMLQQVAVPQETAVARPRTSEVLLRPLAMRSGCPRRRQPVPLKSSVSVWRWLNTSRQSSPIAGSRTD
jgi:hypothetical protein